MSNHSLEIVQGIDRKIKQIFKSTHEKINASTWALKTRIALKTNKINSSLAYQISPAHGLSISADINKHLGLNVQTDNSSVGAGLSNIYPRGFMVKYTAIKKTDLNLTGINVADSKLMSLNLSDKFLEDTQKGYCYTTKTYNTTNTDSVNMTTEHHINSDCVIGSAIGASAAVFVPQIVIPSIIGTSLLTPALVSADSTNSSINYLKQIDKKSLIYKINSGQNMKLNYKISDMLKHSDMINYHKK